MPDEPIIEIDRLPSEPQYKSNAWVDYVELLCLINGDGEISRADVLDRMRDREDLGERPEQMAELVDASEVDDRWSRLAADWFSYLGYREAAFGEFYPFQLGDHDRGIAQEIGKRNMNGW